MEERTGIRDHACRLENRNAASLTGVREVVSFDENQVVMDTDMGLLTIKGKDLHVSRLTVEKGELEVEGQVDSLAYSSNEAYRKTGQSILARLFWLMAAVCREARLLLHGIAVGAILMAVYDILRFLRMLIPHGSLAVGVEDFCYWIWSGFFTFLFLYRENDGALRFYMIGSIFLSMLAYDRIISRNLRKVLKMVLRCIRMKLHR